MSKAIRRDVELWLSSAKRDLDSAELLYRHERWELVTFLAQQCAEKALKALYIHFTRQEPPREHSLVRLYLSLKDFVKLNVDDLAFLTKFYTISRYPDASHELPHLVITREEARRALEVARSVVKLSSEVIGIDP